MCCHIHHGVFWVCRAPRSTSPKPLPMKWGNSHPGWWGRGELMRSWMFTHLFIQQTLMSIDFVPDTILTSG